MGIDSGIAALLGAAIGGLASFGGTFFSVRSQRRHERLKMAVDLAIKENEQIMKIIEMKPGKYNIAPMSAWVLTNFKMLTNMAEGSLTPKTIAQLKEESDALLKAFGEPNKL